MKKKIVIVISIFIIIAAFAVWFYFKKTTGNKNKNSWQNEIAMAQECGMDSLKCCVDMEPSCYNGEKCCTDPSNPSLNMCKEDCTCGELNNYCCKDGQKCKDGLSCSGGICVKCGGKTEPCCGGANKCDKENLICSNEKCLECGLSGNPCCANEPACLDSKKSDETRTECQNNVCVNCGSRGKVSCFGEPKCLAGFLLNNEHCIACGKLNNPCCNQESGNGYVCDPEMKLKCNMGFCSQ